MQQQCLTTVRLKVWDINDTYLTVDVQIDSAKFKAGDTVKVTVEKI